ncbi:hypothetical protein pdul_cds_31 [Pandoravirus dulcis]|uniref:Uncharacterized protein n=1 Tax=Pandoravirus dulcis TaxID=1349409 RepID=S4VNR3_9VIRU|nr:hypothetical protein pdul_cds_31 [Pandoravirus dulcis]AGO81908.2 hypothetical protein pdul_cds_31 [Pandoravirus dulcis]
MPIKKRRNYKTKKQREKSGGGRWQKKKTRRADRRRATGSDAPLPAPFSSRAAGLRQARGRRPLRSRVGPRGALGRRCPFVARELQPRPGRSAGAIDAACFAKGAMGARDAPARGHGRHKEKEAPAGRARGPSPGRTGGMRCASGWRQSGA